MATAAIPIITGGLSLLGSIFGHKSQNKQVKDIVDRNRSGIDLQNAIRNAYAPWYGGGGGAGSAAGLSPQMQGTAQYAHLDPHSSLSGAGGNNPMTPTSDSLAALLQKMVMSGAFPQGGGGMGGM